MLKNIAIYLAVAAAAFVFSLYYFKWFSFALLLIICAIPLLSLVISLPFMLACARKGLELKTDERLTTGDQAKILLAPRRSFSAFCPVMRVRLSARNSFAGTRRKLSLSYSGSLKKTVSFSDGLLARDCGAVELTLKSCRAYDLLGIFFVPLCRRQSATVLVFPRPAAPRLLPEGSSVKVAGYRPKSGGGFSDYYELRGYQSGDSVKNIHWKLSSKRGELIIREPSVPVYLRLILRLSLCSDQRANADILARYLSACLSLLKQGSSCCCMYGGCLREVTNAEQLYSFIASVYSGARLDSDVVAAKGCAVYTVSRDGEEVDEL